MPPAHWPPSAIAGNLRVAGTPIPAFQCPTNPLSNLRTGGNRDSSNYATTDYTTIPYVEYSGALPNQYRSAVMTGSQYPLTLYKDYAAAATVSPTKTVQLATLLPGIDPFYGLAKVGDVRDGLSNTMMMYEDVGRNEGMNGAGVANDYYDPTTGEGRKHWRWADPDTTSGVSKKVNNNRNGTMDSADPNPEGTCPSRRAHDCGPNNEIFSFHQGGGAHVVFADGHVTFLRQTASVAVVKALATRANSKVVSSNESSVTLEGIDD